MATAVAEDEIPGENPAPVEEAPAWTNPVEAAYTAIWDGFYGPGKSKLLLKASVALFPNGKPAFEFCETNDDVRLLIFLEVDTQAFEAWRYDAHQKLAALGPMQCKPVPFNAPGARIIGGRAFRFCDEGEACVQRWEKSRYAKKTALAVRIEGLSKSGKPFLKWEAPIRLFTRGEDNIEFPCPLRNLNRLLDVPQSIWSWTQPGTIPEVGAERASFNMLLTKLSQFRSASVASCVCTIIDETDFMPGILENLEPELLKIEEDMVEVPGKHFAIGRHEVTQEIWSTFMNKAAPNPSYFKGLDLPVENVTWDNCEIFLKKLNSFPFFRLRGQIYRFPTEEEWEYACRAGAQGPYCLTTNGTEIVSGTLGTVAWIKENSERKTHPVGEKEPNAFGLYDMHGNVWEWTSTVDETDKIIKGGGWNGDPTRCETSNRNRYYPAHGNSFLGLRLLRVTPDIM